MTREIVLGPPGTGKTTHLLGIVEEELERGTAPDRVAFVSFTRRAAREAVDRARERFGLRREDLPWFRTLHSLCFAALGAEPGGMLVRGPLREFGELVGYELGGEWSPDTGAYWGQTRGDRLVLMDNLARVRGIPVHQQWETEPDEMSWWEVDRFSRALEAFKRDMGLRDFTDLLEEFVRVGHAPPIEVLLVDESQDLSPLQWRVVDVLAASARRVVVAGDDDQAIYRWAGADVDALIGMEGSVRVLSQSWRVPRAPQRLAHQIVSTIGRRREKNWSPRDEEGDVSVVGELTDVDLDRGDVLLLARNRALLRPAEAVVRAAGHHYEVEGRSSVREELLSAVLAWERWRKEPIGGREARSVLGWVSAAPPCPAGDAEDVPMASLGLDPGLPWFEGLTAVPLPEMAHLRAMLRRGEDPRAPPRIRLSTIHGMKGGQASTVVLLSDMATRTHAEYLRSPDDEARVWYVAVTRALHGVTIVSPRSRKNYPLEAFASMVNAL